MSEAQLAEIVGRASTDEAFSKQLFDNFEEGLKNNGYNLSDSEVADLKARFSGPPPRPGPQGQPAPTQQPPGFLDTIAASVRADQVQNETRAQAQQKRANDLAEYTVNIFKKTLDISAHTYKMVTLMNSVMFSMGVLLFLFAAFYGVFTHSIVATATFGTLGAATFITLFFSKPIERTQSALSSLIQAEVAFMSYFEQVSLADGYAALCPPGSGQPTHEHIAGASEMLQKRSREAIELLQIYVGHDSPSLTKEEQEAKANTKAAAEPAADSAKAAVGGTA